MTEAELRPTRLAWSALCFGLFAVLALLVATGWAPMQDLDTDLGTWPESFTFDHHGVYEFWRWVSIATSTIPETIATIVVAIALEARNHRRAAIWTIGVMSTIALLVWALKSLIGRARARCGPSRSWCSTVPPSRPAMRRASPVRPAWRSCCPACWCGGAAYGAW